MKLINEIKKEESYLSSIVKDALRISKQKNVMIEVYVKKTIGISVNVRNSILENVAFNKDGALFLTVYNKFSKVTVSSKDFSESSINEMLDKAINISKYSSSDFFTGLPDIKSLYFNSLDLDLFHPWNFDIKKLIEFAMISEKEAFKYDKKIVNSEGSFFNSHITLNILGNSLGMFGKYKSTCYSKYTCVIAQDSKSMQRDFDYSISRKINELETSEKLGKKAAYRAISRLGSHKINTIKIPVIFSSEMSHTFFSHFARAINGNYVSQKSTFLLHDMKKKIFPEWINIQENPHLLQGLGSKPFDHEGVATSIKYIVYQGILQTWLLNTYNARKLNLSSTGNSGGISNWLVSYKKISFQDLLKEMNQGLLITELMGQGVDVVTGNYSRGAFGFWIEKGVIKHPVSEITISGNLRLMWNNIVSISNDVDVRNKIQCGSILISEMQVSGM